ncbi:MAG: 50S ribosomal protein L13 [Patescibacteria group bacterium]
MKTRTLVATKGTDIEHNWQHVDVNGKVLGRVATEIALRLTGKSKPYFVRHLDCGDHVVVTGAKDVVVTGRKAAEKIYTSYSGYPGGLRKESFTSLHTRRPEEVIIRAVTGMLPKNKLRDKLLKRLYVFPGSEHKYMDKLKVQKIKTV